MSDGLHLVMMRESESFVRDIASQEGWSIADAEAWLERRRGVPLDPNAMLKLRWDEGDSLDRITRATTLKLSVMSDQELDRSEAEARKANGERPRRPWEPKRFERFMGGFDRWCRALQERQSARQANSTEPGA